jgi:hypothetical protein
VPGAKFKTLKAKFKSVKVYLPTPRKSVWTVHIRTAVVQMGYYSSEANAFFNMNGEGIAVSHWTEIVPPDAPAQEDLINTLQ